MTLLLSKINHHIYKSPGFKLKLCEFTPELFSGHSVDITIGYSNFFVNRIAEVVWTGSWGFAISFLITDPTMLSTLEKREIRKSFKNFKTRCLSISQLGLVPDRSKASHCYTYDQTEWTSL